MVDQRIDRISHPERYPQREGLPGALAAPLVQSRRRNEAVLAAFEEGFRREHEMGDADPVTEENSSVDPGVPSDPLGAASLGRLFEAKRAEQAARFAGLENPPPGEETPS